MAFRPRRALKASRWQRVACQAFGVVFVLWEWTVASRAASVHPGGPRFPPKGLQPRERGRPQKQPAEPLSIAAMIDGDSCTMEEVESFMAELREYGDVVLSKFFAEPRRRDNRKWKAFLDSNGLELITVARGSNQSQDPNDHAIYGQVRQVMRAQQANAVGLMVQDSDYVSLVQEAVGVVKRCFVRCPVNMPSLARRFGRAGAQVLRAAGQLTKAERVIVLRSNGTGGSEPAPQQYVLPTEEDTNNLVWIQQKLLTLGYLSEAGDPCLPAMAKFWFENDLGELVVRPPVFATRALAKLFRERPGARWLSSRQDLAFISQVFLVTSERAVKKYGSKACAQSIIGGGPFIARDSPTIVEDVFRKMGFVDDDKNTCFEEAVDVFANLSCNARALRKAGLQFTGRDTTMDKREKVRKLFLSSSFHGKLQIRPGDGSVRTYLVKRGFLSDASASSDEVFSAMAPCVSSAGLVPKKTYNGLVLQCLDVFGHRRTDPKSRQ